MARLSGGQRQAVAIARAIYWKAKVVIMDEPTAALAVMERENVIAHARDLAADGAGVIYVGHNLVGILEVADRDRRDVPRPHRPRHPGGRDQPGRTGQVHDRLYRHSKAHGVSPLRNREENDAMKKFAWRPRWPCRR